MPMIDKERIQSAVAAFLEQCLPMVCVVGANVNHPRQPELPNVVDPSEKASWQYFKETFAIAVKELRAETPPRVRNDSTCRHRKPACGVRFKEGICYE